MKIVGSITVEDYIGRFFTNYNLAYAGEQFSEAFLKWIGDYVNDTLKIYRNKDIPFYHLKSTEISVNTEISAWCQIVYNYLIFSLIGRFLFSY